MRPWLLGASALFVAGAAQAAVITVAAGPDAQERVQTALIDAKPGDTVALGAGRFTFTDGLSLDVDDVTVKGAGPDKTFLDFKGQKSAGDGLLITSDRVVVRDLAMQDTKGDGIKAKGVDQISYLNVLVEWTGGPKETNGAYGVYPVSSTNVLIDRVVVKGAADAGIYVGQSMNIVVKNSRAEFNVAGIEIENSMNADVFDNVATHNAGGILVFDLPDLPQQGGHSTRVFRNKVVDNDTPNFAPKNSTVAGVPTGTGVMVMANRNVHVFDNEIAGNQSAAVMVIGYRQEIKDAKYDALPRDIVVRGNKLGRNGWAPNFAGGAELAKAVGGSIPPVLWDGASSFVRAGEKTTQSVNMVFEDGPVLNLNLATPSDLAAARPAVTPNLVGQAVPAPDPVKLPPAQAKLAP